MFHFFQIICTLPLRICYPTKFIGKNNIPKGACIISSNHTSNMDVVTLAEEKGGSIVVITSDVIWTHLQRLGMNIELALPLEDEILELCMNDK